MKYFLYLFICSPLFSQEIIEPEMTMVWEPVPEIVTPGNLYSPPSDAIVLFDGTDLSQWSSAATGGESQWIINDDRSMTVKKGSGIETKEEFGSVQLHIEWKTPKEIEGVGQGLSLIHI